MSSSSQCMVIPCTTMKTGISNKDASLFLPHNHIKSLNCLIHITTYRLNVLGISNKYKIISLFVHSHYTVERQGMFSYIARPTVHSINVFECLIANKKNRKGSGRCNMCISIVYYLCRFQGSLTFSIIITNKSYITISSHCHAILIHGCGESPNNRFTTDLSTKT